MSVFVEVSWGELLDRVTILQIKAERIQDSAKVARISREIEALLPHCRQALDRIPTLQADIQALKGINEELWELHEAIRDCERQKDFGERFVALARAACFTNDRRAAVKRQLNDALGSGIVEEKSYPTYA